MTSSEKLPGSSAAGRLRLAAAAALLLFLTAAALELGARLLYRPEGNLHEITRILNPDRRLFWAHKPDLRTTFAGAPFRTNSLGFRGAEPEKQKRRFRIVLMGASPAKGWGVREEESFLEILSSSLPGGAAAAEAVNASVVGYSSFQGLALFREKVLPLRPDLVIIAYGVNDPDKYRFFRDSAESDKEVRPASALGTALHKTLRSSRALSLYALALHRLLPAPEAAPGVFRSSRRVSEEDFAANIRELALAARAAGAKVILATNPFMLPPDTARPGLAARQEADRLAGLYEASCAREKCEAGLLEAALKADPGSPRALFGLAAGAKGEEKARLSRRILVSELEDCLFLVERYNRRIREVSRDLRVPLCDLEAVFTGGGRRKPEYFLDPARDMVHFSPAGHRAAAAALLAAAGKMVK